MSTEAKVDFGGIVFRNTNAGTGRQLAVTPENSAMKHLAYARVILNSATPAVSFASGGRETALICLSGRADVRTDGQEFQLGRFDGLYIPRDSLIGISTESEADVAEFSADVKDTHPTKLVRYAETSQDPGLKFTSGGTGSTRQVNLLIAKNVQAGRLLVGFTHSEPGNWTSWPPHEHTKMLEEMYVYFDMPEPAYGIQLVYNDHEYPELVTVVRDGDAVLIPSGYHPNVAVPGHRIAFLWAMAAHREVEDRQFGVVNVQPGFQPVAAQPQSVRK